MAALVNPVGVTEMKGNRERRERVACESLFAHVRLVRWMKDRIIVHCVGVRADLLDYFGATCCVWGWRGGLWGLWELLRAP